MKKGLVLEGGAMRGMFTAGVLDVLMENHIVFDGACGVSAGAAFGCNYKSHQIGRVIRYNKKLCRNWRYNSLRSLILTGDLYGGDFCYHQIPEKLDVMDFETYRKNPMEFWACASDCETGKSVYRNLEKLDYEDLEFMRAGASMPLASKPVKICGMTLLDGGMTDSIPLEFMENKGYEKNVVILTQPENFEKKQSHGIKLIRLFLKKYPNLVRAMKNRPLMYNKEKAFAFRRMEEGKALVICPEKDLGISRTSRNPSELQRVYDEGRKAGEKNLEKITDFLGL